MSAWKFENWIAASWNKLSRGQHVIWGVSEILFRERSAFQEVIIAHVPDQGRGLFLDGVVQFIESDEFIYHEHLVLPPLLYHPSPRRVLILGGGDGLALREVLRDPLVEQVVLVDIDEVVVRACRQYCADLNQGSLDSPQATVVIEDAQWYLDHPDQAGRFDVVIMDLIDIDSLEVRDLYARIIAKVTAALAPDGIFVTHGQLILPLMTAFEIRRLLASHFGHVAIHRAYIPSYTEDWAFLLASNALAFEEVEPAILRQRSARLAGPLRALLPETFPATFRLPAYLDDWGRAATLIQASSPSPAATKWIEDIADLDSAG